MLTSQRRHNQKLNDGRFEIAFEASNARSAASSRTKSTLATALS